LEESKVKTKLAILVLMAIGALFCHGAVSMDDGKTASVQQTGWNGGPAVKIGLVNVMAFPQANQTNEDRVRTAKRSAGEYYFDISNSSLSKPIVAQFAFRDGSETDSAVDSFISASKRGEGPLSRQIS